MRRSLRRRFLRGELVYGWNGDCDEKQQASASIASSGTDRGGTDPASSVTRKSETRERANQSHARGRLLASRTRAGQATGLSNPIRIDCIMVL